MSHAEGSMTAEAMITIYTAERHVLLGYIMAIVRDYQLAEDVYQETAVVILKDLNGFDPSRDFRAWMRGVARNKAKQALTRVSREQKVPMDELEALIDQSYEEQGADDRAYLIRYQAYLPDCMGRLIDWQRTAVRLRYAENLNLTAIARHLDKSVGAVQVGLSRARDLLHKCIEKKWRLAQAMGGEA